MKAVTRIIAVGALLASLAACSSGSGGSSDGGSDTTMAPGDTQPSGSVEFDENDCLASAEAFGGIAVEVSKAMTDPASFDRDAFVDLIEVSRKAVSSEVRDEFDLISGIYLEIADAYGRLEDPTDVMALAQDEEWQAVIEKMSQADFNAAYESLGQYYASACGLGN